LTSVLHCSNDDEAMEEGAAARPIKRPKGGGGGGGGSNGGSAASSRESSPAASPYASPFNSPRGSEASDFAAVSDGILKLQVSAGRTKQNEI